MGTGKLFNFGIWILTLGLDFYSCQSKADITLRIKGAVTVPIRTSLFFSDGLAEPVSILSRTLPNGFKAEGYKMVAKSNPTDHNMGLLSKIWLLTLMTTAG